MVVHSTLPSQEDVMFPNWTSQLHHFSWPYFFFPHITTAQIFSSGHLRLQFYLQSQGPDSQSPGQGSRLAIPSSSSPSFYPLASSSNISRDHLQLQGAQEDKILTYTVSSLGPGLYSRLFFLCFAAPFSYLLPTYGPRHQKVHPSPGNTSGGSGPGTEFHLRLPLGSDDGAPSSDAPRQDHAFPHSLLVIKPGSRSSSFACISWRPAPFQLWAVSILNFFLPSCPFYLLAVLPALRGPSRHQWMGLSALISLEPPAAASSVSVIKLGWAFHLHRVFLPRNLHSSHRQLPLTGQFWYLPVWQRSQADTWFYKPYSTCLEKAHQYGRDYLIIPVTARSAPATSLAADSASDVSAG